MTTIVFHGLLAKKFGEKVKVRLGRLNDFVLAVDAIKTGFRDFLLKLNKNNQDYTVHLEKNGKEIHLVPSIIGAGKTLMIIIAVIIIVIICIIAWYLAPYIGSSGASFLGTLTGTATASTTAGVVAVTAVGTAFSVGVSLLITALTMPSAPGSSDATGQAAMAHSGGSTSNTDGSTRSYVFDNLQNDAFQGKPIPIGYGRMKVGSNVIGVSMRTYPLDQLFNNEIAIKNIPVTIYD